MDKDYEQAVHSRGNMNGPQTNEKILNLTHDREMHIKTIKCVGGWEVPGTRWWVL